MVKQVIELDGVVKETLPGGKFRVTVDGQDHEIIAVMSGKVRMNRIKIVVGDRVKLEFSPYDLNNGRISFRYSGSRPRDERPLEKPAAPKAEQGETSDSANKPESESEQK